MAATEIIAIIRDLGFPIFVTLWFMYRTEKVINRNTDSIEKLTLMIEAQQHDRLMQ
jgi:hypothetical protein